MASRAHGHEQLGERKPGALRAVKKWRRRGRATRRRRQSGKFEFGDVANDPLNAVSKFFQPSLVTSIAVCEISEDGDVWIAPGQQVIDERGFTAANIDNGG